MHLQVSGAGNLTSKANELNGLIYITIATNSKSKTSNLQSTAFISGSIKATKLTPLEKKNLKKGKFVTVKGFLSTYKGHNGGKETIVRISQLNFPKTKKK